MDKGSYGQISRIFNGFRNTTVAAPPPQPNKDLNSTSTAAQVQSPSLQQIKLHLFYFLWPIALLVYHGLLSKGLKKQEKGILKLVKILILIIYCVTLIVNRRLRTSYMRYATLIMMISLPILSFIYTQFTFFVLSCAGRRIFSNRQQPDEGVDSNAMQAINRIQRRQQDRQAAFDQANFAGGLVEPGQELVGVHN